MTRLLLDTHIHTSETSRCGSVAAKKIVRLYRERDYDGIVITDHYHKAYFDSLGGAGWAQKADCFLKGYRLALEEGEKIGLKVLLGIEIRFDGSDNDYLVYGTDEAFIMENKEMYAWGLSGFRDVTKDREIAVIQAHPFRPLMTLEDSRIDGIEVYNGNVRHDSQNHLARVYAEEHGLKMTSGSDMHEMEDLARGGVTLKKMPADSAQFANMILNGKISGLIMPVPGCALEEARV